MSILGSMPGNGPVTTILEGDARFQNVLKPIDAKVPRGSSQNPFGQHGWGVGRSRLDKHMLQEVLAKKL